MGKVYLTIKIALITATTGCGLCVFALGLIPAEQTQAAPHMVEVSGSLG